MATNFIELEEIDGITKLIFNFILFCYKPER